MKIFNESQYIYVTYKSQITDDLNVKNRKRMKTQEAFYRVHYILIQ